MTEFSATVQSIAFGFMTASHFILIRDLMKTRAMLREALSRMSSPDRSGGLTTAMTEDGPESFETETDKGIVSENADSYGESHK